MPATVSPGWNCAAFSSHVPRSSLCVRRIFFPSLPLKITRSCCPTVNRSAGWEIRDTEMLSMGIRDGMPQPMSTKQPNGSRWVTQAGRMSPGRHASRYCAWQRSWAMRRDKMARGAPAASQVSSVTTKHTGLFTREIRAMSRVVPSRMPTAPSFRGITACMPGSSTHRLWELSQMVTRPSRMVPRSMASASRAGVLTARLFSSV